METTTTTSSDRRNKISAIVSVVMVVVIGIAAILVSRSADDNAPASVAAASSAPSSTGATASSASSAPLQAQGSIFIATAKVPEIAVFAAPFEAKPSKTLKSPWFVDGDQQKPVALVFAVKQQQEEGWLQVLLPTRPSGLGWVHASDVDITSTNFHITIGLSAHHLTVFDGDKVVLEDTVAVGAPGTPTSKGDFYLVGQLQAPKAGASYGPFALFMSGHAASLGSFNGDDAEFALHGNDDASTLGQDVTRGAVRMSNDAITRLAALVPLGTPVSIVA